jgi:DNA polymerase I
VATKDTESAAEAAPAEAAPAEAAFTATVEEPPAEALAAGETPEESLAEETAEMLADAPQLADAQLADLQPADVQSADAEPARRGRLLLLDGHSLAYRAFHALPPENFSTTTGQPTNAVYGFTAMLINVLRDEQPTHVAVAFDRAEKTFRHEQYVEYKATRKETPSDFRSQLSLIFEVLDVLGITRLSVPGYEADDIIATLATQAEPDMDVLIVTGDRDPIQLVTDHVTLLYTMRGISEMARFTPESVAAKYGLTPAQYPDFAALRGDPSDNLPGIPGVGEKTATRWIAEFGSLANLVDRVDEVKGKAGDALREHLAGVLRNSQLTQLVRDMALEVRPADLRPVQWDREQIHQLFDTLQFRVLRDRLYSTLPNGIGVLAAAADVAAADAAAFDVAAAILGPDEVSDWIDGNVAGPGRSGLAVSGSWGRGTGTLTGLAIAAPGGVAAWIDPIHLTEADDKALGAWLADPARPKALHDAKGPMHALAALGFELAGLSSDTALAAYLALPGQRSFDLADLSLRYLNRELRDAEPASGQLTLDVADDTEIATALAQRAQATAELADALDRDLAERGATDLLADVELPLVRVLADMERAGIAADTDHFADMSASLGGEVKAAEQAAFAVTGHEFNLGSPKQLQEVLFTELGLPKTKRIKTGYTTDSEALTSLLAQTEHPVLAHLLRHRDVARLKSIVDSLIPMADADGRIHTTYNQMIAATGRLSSTDPNLQNIPIRSEEGRRIRQGFVVGPGHEYLLTADYSQIELRIMAHLSGDQALAAAFSSGHDFHASTAGRVFGVAPEHVTQELRSKVKAMNYGLAYGLSAYGLSQQLRISPEEARGYMEEYFEQFGGVRDYLRDVVARARMDGYTQTMLGRRRYLPDLTSDNRQRREMAERMALNAPIQGSAADIIKVAMLTAHLELKGAGLRSRMLLQVHDELLFEVAPGELDAVRELVTVAMGSAADLSVPLEVSMGWGRSWADAAH